MNSAMFYSMFYVRSHAVLRVFCCRSFLAIHSMQCMHDEGAMLLVFLICFARNAVAALLRVNSRFLCEYADLLSQARVKLRTMTTDCYGKKATDVLNLSRRAHSLFATTATMFLYYFLLFSVFSPFILSCSVFSSSGSLEIVLRSPQKRCGKIHATVSTTCLRRSFDAN